MVASLRMRPTVEAMAEQTDPSAFFVPAAPGNLLKADPSRRRPVTFASNGHKLAGHIYRPPNVSAETVTAGVDDSESRGPNPVRA